ncbi:MAG TPA: hypothetical protein VEN28_12980 [Burkholderiaceae bacterium]|nr:hypothetical protein [Burkholderiaceae bacterium]
MVQMHNVTVSLAQAEERAPQLESAEGNEPPVYAPPYEQVPTVRLPTKEDIAKSLKEQRASEVGSAQQESAIAAAAATSGSGAVNANAFASLGEPAIALSLRFRPDPPPITSSQINDPLAAVALNPQPLPPRALALASQINDPLAAVALNPQPLPPRALASASDVGDPLLGLKPEPNPLPPRGLMMASGGFEGPEAPQLPNLPVRDIDKELQRALNRKAIRPQSTSPAQVDNPLVAIGLNPQPLPPKNSLQDIAKPRR